ncbi:MAG: hypothetical protein M0P95_17700 [Sulfuritalea sp.]|jgi:hypothetical protein|nr:hypothetical protein [Sulfuritalea sp.]
MSVDNQIEIPQSFMAMYVAPGHSRPNATQEAVLARYEQCEDMACMLTEHAQTLAFKEDFTEQEVLVRCHQGLQADASDFTEAESRWVILRLAELLKWTPPKFCDGEVHKG